MNRSKTGGIRSQTNPNDELRFKGSPSKNNLRQSEVKSSIIGEANPSEFKKKAGKYFNDTEGTVQDSATTKLPSSLSMYTMSIKGDAGKLFNAHGRISKLTSDDGTMNKNK